jgi:hypothetical protein
MTGFHVGHNLPGYLPESDVSHFDNIDDAISCLVEDIRMVSDNLETWSDEHDCDDIPCPTYGDSCPWNQAGDCDSLISYLTDDADITRAGGDFLGYAAGLAWWIVPCDEEGCDND